MSLLQPDEPSGALPGPKTPRPSPAGFPADMPGVERVAHFMAFEIARQIAAQKNGYVSATDRGVWVHGSIDLIAVVEALMGVATPLTPT